MTKNRAKEFLRQRGETVADWDGICGELANAVMTEKDNVLWVEGDIQWRFHMVPLIDGLVHDAWCEREEALPVSEWLRVMFAAAEIELSLNGEVIYLGPADEFVEVEKLIEIGEVKV